MAEHEELWDAIRSIPAGRVVSYGNLGRSLSSPASGYFVGRWMAKCPEGLPWWRVVAKDGRLPVWKKNPDLERLQIQHLEAEGVKVVEGKVDMAEFEVDLDSTF
jgi:methylated-DNA-protein-cysteine methyltransferase related protein